MYTLSDMKSQARSVIRSHYILLVFLTLFSALLGSEFRSALNLIKARSDSDLGFIASGVTRSILDGDLDAALDYASGKKSEIIENSFTIFGLEFGHTEGVFSELINEFASGSVAVAIAGAVLRITGSTRFVSALYLIWSVLIRIFKIIFLSGAFKIILTRMVLESRIYPQVDSSTLTYLFRTGTWIKVSLTYFRFKVIIFLWMFTIVGGPIKYYTYAMVPYILAESPNLSLEDAMELSRRMMEGNRLKLFKLDLSFVGWYVLSFFTGNLLSIFFVNPYFTATRCEFFVNARREARRHSVEVLTKLNDYYLYEKAEPDMIKRAYSDVIDAISSPDIELPQPSRIRAFFQNVFGVVLWYDRRELLYREVSTRKADIDAYRSCVEGREYPARLSPLKERYNGPSFEHMHYMRHYSFSSLVLIFFTFCFVGWLWEVALHIYEDGRFVNRGVLHGPWLPIYGVGALVILMFLYALRKNPIAEFFSAITLCGVIEYFGGLALELSHDGQKWWDYTGYFLNINGRVCAEGLLVFGLAGIAAVYFVAPLLDDMLDRFSEKKKIVICLTLLTIFVFDLIVSHYYPNTGEGITDYALALVKSCPAV